MEIVELTENNIRDAGKIHSESWKESHKNFCSEEFVARHTEEAQTEYIRSEIAKGKDFYMLIDHIPVGIVSMYGNLIENLYILPAEQRKGYGAILLQYALRQCHGIPTLWIDSFVILAIFQNGIEKTYDMKKLFEIFPQFQAFETITGLFEQVKVNVGGYGVFWNDELDLDAEEIWENGIETGIRHEITVYEMLAENLLSARAQKGMTQKELSEATKIYQADISKIERGVSNPSVSTLQRIADGLGKKLVINFE